MAEQIYINDDFGNKIPLLDTFGNLSVQAIMLYTEDKLTSADRKIVDDFVATDEMSKDALEGYALTSNASKTRHTINELNASIQKQSGAKSVSPLVVVKKDAFDYRKLAAAIGLLIVVGGGTFVVSQFFGNDELAESKPTQNEKTQVVKPVKKSPNVIIEVDSLTLNPESPTETEQLNATAQRETAEKDINSNQQKLKQEEKPKATGSTAERENQKFEEDRVTKANAAEKDADDLDAEKQVEAELAEVSLKSEESVIDGEEKQRDELASYSRNKKLLLDDESAGVGLRQPKASSESVPAQELMSASDVKEELSSTAKYPGGDIMMYQFLEKKKNYPEALRAQGIKGNVTVTFKVEEDGSISNPQIKKGVNGILDADALRIVRSMPKWSPATEKGVPVSSNKSVVIRYGE